MAGFEIGAMLAGINIGGLLYSVGIAIIFFAIFGAIIAAGIIYFKNKTTYVYPINFISQFGSNSVKTQRGLRGGIIKGSSGVSDFAIKIPRRFRKKFLGYMPDLSLVNGNGELTFIAVGDRMIWQQVKESLITQKEVQVEVTDEKGKKTIQKTILLNLIQEPIPVEVKQITINNIHKAENVLDGDRLKAGAMIIGGFIIMVIVQIIYLIIVAKK